MDKNLKKLYSYCKSQEYKGSPKIFKQELKELAVQQLGTEELTGVAGGKKTTTALTASLVSALSLTNSLIYAHTNSLDSKINNKVMSKSIAQTDKSKNEKKLKNILLKAVLPVGAVLGLAVINGGIAAPIIVKKVKTYKNTELNKKLVKFYSQLLSKLYKSFVYYCKNNLQTNLEVTNCLEKMQDSSVYGEIKISNIDIANEVCNQLIKFTSLENLSDECNPAKLHDTITQWISKNDIKENSEGIFCFVTNTHSKVSKSELNPLAESIKNYLSTPIENGNKPWISPSIIHDALLKIGNGQLWNEVSECDNVKASIAELENEVNQLLALSGPKKIRELRKVVQKNIKTTEDEALQMVAAVENLDTEMQQMENIDRNILKTVKIKIQQIKDEKAKVEIEKQNIENVLNNANEMIKKQALQKIAKKTNQSISLVDVDKEISKITEATSRMNTAKANIERLKKETNSELPPVVIENMIENIGKNLKIKSQKCNKLYQNLLEINNSLLLVNELSDLQKLIASNLKKVNKICCDVPILNEEIDQIPSKISTLNSVIVDSQKPQNYSAQVVCFNDDIAKIETQTRKINEYLNTVHETLWTNIIKKKYEQTLNQFTNNEQNVQNFHKNINDILNTLSMFENTKDYYQFYDKILNFEYNLRSLSNLLKQYQELDLPQTKNLLDQITKIPPKFQNNTREFLQSHISKIKSKFDEVDHTNDTGYENFMVRIQKINDLYTQYRIFEDSLLRENKLFQRDICNKDKEFLDSILTALPEYGYCPNKKPINSRKNFEEIFSEINKCISE